MAAPKRREGDSADLQRVTREVAGRLAARGIPLTGEETSDEITALEDAVERWEMAVESHGGDLMVDEPPKGQAGEPDDPRLLLPKRKPGTPVARYIEQLSQAMEGMR